MSVPEAKKIGCCLFYWIVTLFFLVILSVKKSLDLCHLVEHLPLISAFFSLQKPHPTTLLSQLQNSSYPLHFCLFNLTLHYPEDNVAAQQSN